jgi:hypothetical protein
MINWKQIKEDYPIQFKSFENFLEGWVNADVELREQEEGHSNPLFTISGFYNLPTYLQLGFFYEYLSFTHCNITLNVLDKKECCAFVENYFKHCVICHGALSGSNKQYCSIDCADAHSCSANAEFTDNGPQGAGTYCTECGALVRSSEIDYEY